MNETIGEMRKKKGKLLEVQLITDSTLHTLKKRCTIAEERLEKTIESETLLKSQLEKRKLMNLQLWLIHLNLYLYLLKQKKQMILIIQCLGKNDY